MAAALEQAEQLARSAEQIAPAAQPLPLFYSISQAGRAIAAAHLAERWELTAHGLRWPGNPGSSNILERLIEPRVGPTSSFQRVADAAGSGQLTGSIELGALWSAIWELSYPELPSKKPEWRRALWVAPSTDWNDALLSGNRVAQLVVGLPDIGSAKAILDELAHYPSARGGMPETLAADPREIVITEQVLGFEEVVAPRIVWQANEATSKGVSEALDRIAPPYRSRSERALIPELPTGDYLSPLMLWWAFLFALSNLARYEPAVWTAVLDVNQSDLAVPLESAMQEAMDSIPHFVLEALVGRFVERQSY